MYKPTNSSYQVLSADVENKHGSNTHGVIFEELHTQPNRKLFDVMLQGSDDVLMQLLYFLLTTAGNDTYQLHLLRGTPESDRHRRGPEGRSYLLFRHLRRFGG